MAIEPALEERRSRLPVFNDNQMKLGVFGQNVSYGCCITLAETAAARGRLEGVTLAARARTGLN